MPTLNEEQQRAVKLHKGRVCIIAGAGSGKCIAGDSMVLTDEGLDRIDYGSCPSDDEKESIKRTKRIVLSHTMEEEVATHWHKVRASSVVHITTASGYELTGTPEHRIKILNNNGNLGWATLDTLSPDSVCAMALSSLYGTRNLGDLGYLLGLLVGDGCLSLAGGAVGFAKNHPAIEAEYRRILGSAFGITKVTTRRKPGTNSVTHTFHSVAAKQELEKLGLKMVTAPFKEVPTCVLEADKKSQIEFIHGLFDTDAGVHAATLEYSTASETLGRQVQLLFLNMGMRINRSLKVVNGKSYWRLQLMGEALRKFHTDIGFGLAHEKQLKLIQAVSSTPNTNRDIIYHQANRFKRLRQHMQKESWWDGHEQAVTHPPMSLKDYFSGKRNPSRQRCDEICKLLPQDDPDVQQLRFLSRHFWFDPIKTVEIVDGDRFVYDLTVNQSHSYVANGFVNHNTRVLIERIADMIESGVPAHSILAFTFTKKAAMEMQERIEQAIGAAVYDLTVGTIHATLWHILQEHTNRIPGYQYGMAILRDWQQRKIIKNIHEEHRLTSEDPMTCRRVIGNAKNRMLHPGNEFTGWLESRGFFPKAIDYYNFVYTEYESEKRRERLIDFDDMLLLTRDMFKLHPDVLRQWQQRWEYISVDEYQDINPVQEAVIDMLSETHGNLFVVGDARQSIFGFRSSDPGYILNFPHKHLDAKVVRLNRNYRCGEVILTHANRLIANNDEGREPMICESGLEGDVVVMDPWDTNEDEAEAVAVHIDNYDGKFKDVAVLYRCNHQSRAVEDALIKHHIPYEIIGSEGFYGRAEIKDLVAYMEVTTAMDDLKDWSFIERIVNRPTRYLGKAFLAEWNDLAKKHGPINCLLGKYSSVNRRSISNVTRLHAELHELNRRLASPAEFTLYIRHNMGYDTWFLENRSDEEAEEIEALSNLNEFSAAATNFTSVQAMLNYIRDVQKRNEQETDSNRVKLMSLHRAKGLEFPVVFVTGMSDVLLPHLRAEDLCEERRLMYVGATRAKEKLTLSYFMTHRNQMVGPSPFFAEMGFLINSETAAGTKELDAALIDNR